MQEHVSLQIFKYSFLNYWFYWITLYFTERASPGWSHTTIVDYLLSWRNNENLFTWGSCYYNWCISTFPENRF